MVRGESKCSKENIEKIIKELKVDFDPSNGKYEIPISLPFPRSNRYYRNVPQHKEEDALVFDSDEFFITKIYFVDPKVRSEQTALFNEIIRCMNLSLGH